MPPSAARNLPDPTPWDSRYANARDLGHVFSDDLVCHGCGIRHAEFQMNASFACTDPRDHFALKEHQR